MQKITSYHVDSFSGRKIEFTTYRYKNFLIRKEYGGYAVTGTMFDTLQGAKDYISRKVSSVK